LKLKTRAKHIELTGELSKADMSLLLAEMERMQAERDGRLATLVACEARLLEQQQELAAQQQALAQLRAGLDEARARIAALLQSKSWRLTAPLRALSRGVTGS
jgi:hypothetical protein